MPLIETEITIDASPARVWSVLTDFENYPRWNPFIRSIAGTKREGERLTVTLGPPDGKTMTFKPRILTFAPDREFSWRGALGAAWIFYGDHHFRLEAAPGGGTRFVHGENFGGALTPLLGKSLDADTGGGFEAMNEALKRQAEAADD